MEKYHFYSYKDFFKKPIRDKIDILKVLVYTLEIILNSNGCDSEKSNITVVTGRKMQRVFYNYENKIFSINFPFSIKKVEKNFELFWNDILVDHVIIATILSLIEIDDEGNIKNKEFFEIVMDNIEDKKYECSFKDDVITAKIIGNSIKILKYLLVIEDGYLRYDCDVENYRKAKEKGNINRHPLHHLDIFYLDDNTFKLGLDNINASCVNMLIDILNIDTDAYFLDMKYQW
ncbi:hypothetical protein ACAG39_08280 [Caldicellulosiruptoraceae bacterium PP1]